MLSRRELMGTGAVGATAALTLSAAAGTAVASRRALEGATSDAANARDGRSAVPPADHDVASPESDAKTSPPPWELLSPLAAGSEVAHGWRVADLSPVQD